MARPSKSPAGPQNGGPLERLKSLYDFMTRHGLEVLELSDADGHVKLVRRTSPAPAAVIVQATGQEPSSPSLSTNLEGTAPSNTPGMGPKGAPALPAGAVTIKSPMMGIFYRAPTPSSPPFVKDGDSVSEGTVLCMVEAMKVFNEIKAEYACTVLKILVENGKPVKAGQDLFAVRRG